METNNQNQEKSLLKSYNWMKSKHPDAVFLFRSAPVIVTNHTRKMQNLSGTPLILGFQRNL